MFESVLSVVLAANIVVDDTVQDHESWLSLLGHFFVLLHSSYPGVASMRSILLQNSIGLLTLL